MAKIYLNEEWKFTEEFTEQLTQTEYDESKLENEPKVLLLDEPLGALKMKRMLILQKSYVKKVQTEAVSSVVR